MRRTSFLFRTSLGLGLTFVAGCPDDGTAVTTSDETEGSGSEEESTDTPETTIDPDTSMSASMSDTVADTSTTDDPTIDPTEDTTTDDPTADSSSTDPTDPTEGSSSTDPTDGSSSGDGGPVCGDDVVNGGDACDGADLDGQDCASQGFDAGELACDDNCAFDTSACTINCGNGTVEDPEDCDDDDFDGATCVSLGFDAGVLACSASCVFDNMGCISFSCGNGIVEGMEVCDGMDFGGQTCITQGFDGGTVSCDETCNMIDTSACTDSNCCVAQPAMSNGCDDAACEGLVCAADPFCCNNTWDGLCANRALDICPALCQTECGDGFVSGAEQCDGANFDGASCQSLGFFSGNLTCDAMCGVSTAECNDPPGPCCTANATPGCEVVSCQNSVCAADASCCDDVWDQACADAATADPNCENSPTCPVATCVEEDIGTSTGPAVASGNLAGEDEDIPQGCGAGGVDHVIAFEASLDGQYIFDLAGSNYDTVLSINSSCDPLSVLGCNDDFIGLASQLTLNMVAGQQVVIAVSGFAGGVGNWVLNITAPAAQPGQQDFAFTGAEQQFVVPPGVNSVHIEAFGAEGATAQNSINVCGASPDVGGQGGQAEGDLAVVPGQILYVNAGGQGNAPGFNGGGVACGDALTCTGGGGASDVRQGGQALANRMIVAAGGGGAEFSCGGLGGGDGGALDGLAGSGDNAAADGGGGTQLAGGIAGVGGGSNGALGQGGASAVTLHSGGGGGGFGGAGGGQDGSGGGGSSYIGGVTGGVTNAGLQVGNGTVSISW